MRQDEIRTRQESEEVAATYRRVAEEFTALLKRELGEQLTSVVLYGSVARGQARKESDIDLLIVVAGSREDRRALEDRICNLSLDFEDGPLMSELYRSGWRGIIQYVLFSEEEALLTRPFYLDIAEDGQILFDREGFFQGKLARLRQRMQELGTRRIYLGKDRWMWKLKADMVPGEKVEL